MRSRLLTLALLSAVPLAAWNPTGHQVIALLAWEHMSEEARGECQRVLDRHPDLERLRTTAAALPVADAAAALYAAAAAWPQQVREEIASPHAHATWHFARLVFEPGTRPLPGASLGGELIEQLQAAIDLYRDPDEPAAERAVALCWVAHLMGELHQPLHTITLVSPQFPNGDDGGRQLWVQTRDGDGNVDLHTWWDQLLGSEPAELGGMLEQVRRQAPPPDDLLAAHKEDVRMWAFESHEVAATVAYPPEFLAEQAAPDCPRHAQRPTVTLPDDYVEQARAQAALQAMLAGTRLVRAMEADGELPAAAP